MPDRTEPATQVQHDERAKEIQMSKTNSLPFDGKELTDQEKSLVHGLSLQVVNPLSGTPASIKMIDQMVKENRSRNEPRHGVIVGDAGCGKTTLMDILQAQEPEPMEEDERGFRLGRMRKMPLLTSSLPSAITPRSMAQEMLREIGDSSNLSGTCFELTERLTQYIKACEVELVVIDEFQHLLALGRGSAKGASSRLLAARNWIKSVINKTGATFLLMGVPETLALLDGDDQLERRFTYIHEIEPFDPPSPSNTDFVHFVDSMLHYCVDSFDFFSNADYLQNSPEDAAKMYAATAGMPSRIKDLLLASALLALRENNASITTVHFTAAFLQLHRPTTRILEANRRRENRRILLSSLEENGVNPFAANDDSIQQLILQMAA